MIEFVEGIGATLASVAVLARWKRHRFLRWKVPPGHWQPRVCVPSRDDTSSATTVVLVRRPSPLQYQAVKDFETLLVNDPELGWKIADAAVRAEIACAELNATIGGWR